MWLAKQVARGKAALGLELQAGQTAVGGELVGDCASRGAARCLPYGVYVRPPQGEALLWVTAQGRPLCLGAVQEEEPPLADGELLLQNAAGASILLRADGQVVINGWALGPDGRWKKEE